MSHNTRSKSKDADSVDSSSESSPSPTKYKRTQDVINSRRSLYPNLPQSEQTGTPIKFNRDENRFTDSPGGSGRRSATYESDRERSLDPSELSTGFVHEASIINSIKDPCADDEKSKTKPKPTGQSKKTNRWSWIIIAAVIAVILGVALFSKPKNIPEAPKGPLANCPQITSLANEFPGQNSKLFKSLRSGVESFRDGETSVFSFFSTDEKIMKNLMLRIINTTQECLQCTSGPFMLGENDISRSELEKYRTELQQRYIMVINNVDRAPITEVPVLHSVCDTYNPLVKPSVIFVTMKVPSAPGESVKPVDFIFNYLNSIWSSLSENIRTPLITRLTDQTFFVK